MPFAYNALRKRPSPILRGLGLLVLAATLGACDVIVEDDYCAGHPIVLNGIPDIGLIAGAEVYIRDLESRPYVFDHTYGDYLYYEAQSSRRSVARAYVDRGVLTVEARNPGVSRIRVDAIDGCDAYTSVEFFVEVYPYGAAGKTSP